MATQKLTSLDIRASGCDAVMKGFNKALGGEVTSDATKSEYNKPLTKNVCVKGGR